MPEATAAAGRPAPSSWGELVAAVDRRRGADSPTEHRPTIAVLSCSDARVPPSIVFDQPAGALFVVRIAGNTASPEALASLDYAVGKLGVRLVVVLGHTHCGAVAAAAAGTCGGHLAPIVAPICDLARRHPDAPPARLEQLNVEATVRSILEHDGPAGDGARRSDVEVRGAVFDLDSGVLVATDRPTGRPSITGQPITDPPITDQPITDQPITDQPITDPPTTHRTVEAT